MNKLLLFACVFTVYYCKGFDVRNLPPSNTPLKNTIMVQNKSNEHIEIFNPIAARHAKKEVLRWGGSVNPHIVKAGETKGFLFVGDGPTNIAFFSSR